MAKKLTEAEKAELREKLATAHAAGQARLMSDPTPQGEHLRKVKAKDEKEAGGQEL